MLQVENHVVTTVAEMLELIAANGVTHVKFAYAYLPTRAVAVTHPKLENYIKRALGLSKPRQPVMTPAERSEYLDAITAVEDMSDFIDFG
jgi:hypothetical protein